METNNDYISLKPFYELIMRSLKSFRKWLKKKLVIILIVFVGLTTYLWTKELVSNDSFESKAFIKSDVLHHNELISLLESVSQNLKNGKNESKRLNKNSYLFDNVTNLEYEINVSEADSILFKENKLNTEKQEITHNVTLKPLEVRIKSKNKADSNGRLLIEYLNEHEFTRAILNKERFFFERKINELEKQIDNIDSLQYQLIRRDDKNSTINDRNLMLNFGDSKTLAELVEIRSRLSEELVDVQTESQHLERNSIFSIDGFSNPKLVYSSALREAKSYVFLFFISLIIVAFISFFFSNSKD